jgi:hypothetical protein
MQFPNAGAGPRPFIGLIKKNLGLIIDEKLDWKPQVDNVTNRVSKYVKSQVLKQQYPAIMPMSNQHYVMGSYYGATARIAIEHLSRKKGA